MVIAKFTHAETGDIYQYALNTRSVRGLCSLLKATPDIISTLIDTAPTITFTPQYANAHFAGTFETQTFAFNLGMRRASLSSRKKPLATPDSPTDAPEIESPDAKEYTGLGTVGPIGEEATDGVAQLAEDFIMAKLFGASDYFARMTEFARRCIELADFKFAAHEREVVGLVAGHTSNGTMLMCLARTNPELYAILARNSARIYARLLYHPRFFLPNQTGEADAQHRAARSAGVVHFERSVSCMIMLHELGIPPPRPLSVVGQPGNTAAELFDAVLDAPHFAPIIEWPVLIANIQKLRELFADDGGGTDTERRDASHHPVEHDECEEA